MLDELDELNNRPKFPARAIITAGMPYGNKELHFGHIGGVYVQADTFARFMRDRIGKENVIFVSGTDCYGSPILVSYQKLVESGEFTGTLDDYVRLNHDKQKEALDKYLIDINLFSASSFGSAAREHEDVCRYFFETLYNNGHLSKITTSQFFDTEKEVFLNGRQVVGRCPIQGCQSTKAYADECELGHPYTPAELIAPKSVLTGNTPEMRDVTNWYFNLPDFRELLSEWSEQLKETPGFRKFIVKTIDEFLKKPVIYVKNEHFDIYTSIKSELPQHGFEEGKTSFTLSFETLPERNTACNILTNNTVRYRTGKTLVPFRLTGNVEWGVPAPDCEGTENLTFWVWPESLFAPVSFSRAYLKSIGKDENEWKKWWLDKDALVYQFIGSDNISFYGPAEVGMWMGMQGKNPKSNPDNGDFMLPYLVAGNHILFLDKKASSSSEIKPPMALDLLEYYTPEQLRSHFLGLGLGMRSVSFQPKPLNPDAKENEADPALKEGNLLTNVLNRVIRSCFYTSQSFFDTKLLYGDINPDILKDAQKTILAYEKTMLAHEFHQVMYIMDSYIRGINKYWVANIRAAEAGDDNELRKQTLVNTFHMLRVAAVLMHPIAPQGTEMLREYLGFGEDFFSWERIFDTVYDFMPDKYNHTLKFLEPKIDFFSKHPSQFE